MPSNPARHTVVIGASMAGLAAARVLADHFDKVTVLDRDRLPAGADPRKGVPQGRHAHALLGGGVRAIEALFPGLMDEMVAGGAGLLDFNDGTWHQAGGYRASCLVERKVVGGSRPFIEGHLRRRVTDLANVRIVDDVAVEGLVHVGERARGVRIVVGGAVEPLEADLVVDCTGRSSQASQWLEAIGCDAPEVVEVRCDMRYATMILQRTASDLDGTFAVIIESPPEGKRAGFLIPIDGDRWIVTLAAGFGAPSPTDELSFHATAASLPSPEIHDVLSKADALSPVTSHRLISSKRRRYEKLNRVPAGFLALGDSICSFNPVYGQGMSSAVMQAVEMGACLESHDNDEHLVKAFYQRAAKVIANPWQIAVGADFAYPECVGPKPLGTDLVNRYMKRVLLAAQVSPEVNTAMIMVQNLLAPPTSLLRPSMMLAVRRAAPEALRLQRAGAGSGSSRQPIATHA